jgi:hypothetical protein
MKNSVNIEVIKKLVKQKQAKEKAAIPTPPKPPEFDPIEIARNFRQNLKAERSAYFVN